MAGRLASTLNDKTIDRLCVKGSVDASDLFFIADELENLKELDLSGCTIEAYRSIPVHGRAHYDAATIPGSTFAASHIETIHFPTDGTLHIGDTAFISSGLKSLNIGCNVTIGTGAFASCESLGEVRIAGRAIIGEYAFRSCKSSRQRTLTGAIEIGVKAFAACSNCIPLYSARISRSSEHHLSKGCRLKSINLENTIVNTIGNRAFAQNTSLENILLPQSVKTLGEGLLSDCQHSERSAYRRHTHRCPTMPSKIPALVTYLWSISSKSGRTLSKATRLIDNHTSDLPSSESATNAMEGMTGLTSIEAALKSVMRVSATDVWSEG